MMRRLGSNGLWGQFSYKGRKGKRPFQALPINQALISKYAVSDIYINQSVFSLSLNNPFPLLPILQEHVIRPTHKLKAGVWRTA